MTNDRSIDWRIRWDHDEAFRRAWAEAAEEIRRFREEEEKEILTKETVHPA